jgi:hypothetical protein
MFCDFFENVFLPVLGKSRFSFNFDFLNSMVFLFRLKEGSKTTPLVFNY